MATVMQGKHTVSAWTILGLKPGDAREVIDSTYERLAEVFDQEQFMETPQSWVQSQQATMAIEDAYRRIWAKRPRMRY